MIFFMIVTYVFTLDHKMFLFYNRNPMLIGSKNRGCGYETILLDRRNVNFLVFVDLGTTKSGGNFLGRYGSEAGHNFNPNNPTF